MAKKTLAKTASPKSNVFTIAAPVTLVFLATALAYLPALSGGFIWNDSEYVTVPVLRSLKGLVRIWTEPGATEQYYPLLHSAFWVQHWVFGDQPLGYHVVTLLLHAGCAVLFALILRRLTRNDADPETSLRAVDTASAAAGHERGRYSGVEWLAALMFALHPVHVESVAWITEQKNTLSLFFYLAAVLVYLRFDETRRPRPYVAALVLFVASLLCKTVTATLPAALLVIFWWKRGRLDWSRDIRPLLPWLAVGAAAGLFSSWVEKVYVGAEGAEFHLSFAARSIVAGRATWFYVGKLVWPFGLSFVYPRWEVNVAVWWQWIFLVGVYAVGVALWAVRGRTRAPLAVFLFFVGSLFPVLGFVNLYGERYSWVWDHWQYLPDLGPIALAAAGLAAGLWWVRLRFRWLGPGLAAALALSLGALTWSHCGIFHDDQTLYRATIACNPACWMARNNLGSILSTLPGRLNDAIAEFEEVLRLKPDHVEAHSNLGVALLRLPGRLDDAIAQFQEALRLKPDFAKAHANLGVVWLEMPGRLNDAISQFEEALRLDPDNVDTHYNLGIALSQLPGRLDDAIAQYQEALRLKPDYFDAHNNLGVALAQMPGRMDDAIAEYKEVLRLKPDYVPGWHNLGTCWFRLGNGPAAAAAFREELRLSPDNLAAQQALAVATQQTQDR